MTGGRLLHRRLLAVLTAALVLLGVPVAPTGAAPSSATVDRAGWWSKTQGATDPIIGNLPVNGFVALPPSPTVPPDTLPVTAVAGEAQTVAALGFSVDAPAGSTVNTFVMHVKSDPAGDQNVASAAIVACPITDLWGETDNGKFADAPVADCSQGAAGARADDGTWTFDLAPFAAGWFDDAGTLTQNGVLLTDAVDAPGTFQVAFERPPDGVSFDVDVTPGSGSTDAFAVGGSDSFGGGDVAVDLGDAPAVAAPATPSAPRPAPRLPIVSTVGHDAGGLGSNLPLGLLVLVPLVLVLAALAGRSLARPTAASTSTIRHGGVSRALRTRTELR
jgi:hypothetical protein